MKPIHRCFQSNEEGKGTAGCLLSLVLLAAVLFVAFKVGPAYYRNYALEGDLKREVSRYGVRTPAGDDVIIKDMIKLGEKNDVRLTKQDIKINRFNGQITITIDYVVPVDFVVLKHDFRFGAKGESFTLS